jgi:exopolysaccharide biosynthesis polyprenyl glycosylphosphotransferase
LLSPAIIVGASDEARLLGEQLVSWPTSGLAVIGYVDDEHPAGTHLTSHLKVLGGLDQLDDFVQRYRIEEVILATSGLTRAAILSIFRKYGTSPDIHLRLSSGLFDIMTTGLVVKELASVPLIGVNRVRLSRTDQVLKAILDYAITLAGLAVLLPVLMLIGILVKLDSPGPVFYRRRVVGLHGKQFDALKFRTMHTNGDQILAANPALMDHLATTHKIKGDPRITRIGQILRKYSLDELPQLINVLRREMSLVGPRMISPPELKNYGQWAMNLLTVRPGLTGLWQVSGRSDVSYEERVRLDMFYIRNYSIWMDLHLIFRTLPVVLSGRGAY